MKLHDRWRTSSTPRGGIEVRAVIVREAGPAEVLRLAEIATPHAGPGRVRVSVRAAGVQPADVAARRGVRPPGVLVDGPPVLGNEFTGVVDEVGEGVVGVSVGDEVIGFTTFGAYAERAVVPAGQVVAKPAGMPWDEAGALSASGQTAHTALEDLGVAPGETLVVHAAAGGVGTMAVQIARARGARVIGTASPSNHDHLRALGAEPVAYGDGLIERIRAIAPGGADATLDAIGNGALAASLGVVADRRRVGTLVDFGAAGRLGVRAIHTRRSAERLTALVRLWEEGSLRVHIAARLPLHDAAAAHRLVEGGHVRGKVVLTVADSPADLVTRAVGAWDGVAISEGRLASATFHLGRRELGYVHSGPAGAGVADLPFPRRLRDELIAAGRARPHRAMPESGWVSVPVRDAAEADEAIALFALARERATAARERRAERAA